MVETGAAATGNGPGSLRTERATGEGPEPPVGSGAERQRYRAAPIGAGNRFPSVTECGIAE